MDPRLATLLERLTPSQREAYPILRQYYFGPRGSGRSYLAAILAIEAALEHPRQWITLFDHTHPFPFVQERQLALIQNLTMGDPDFEFRVSSHPMALRYQPMPDLSGLARLLEKELDDFAESIEVQGVGHSTF